MSYSYGKAVMANRMAGKKDGKAVHGEPAEGAGRNVTKPRKSKRVERVKPLAPTSKRKAAMTREQAMELARKRPIAEMRPKFADKQPRKTSVHGAGSAGTRYGASNWDRDYARMAHEKIDEGGDTLRNTL